MVYPPAWLMQRLEATLQANEGSTKRDGQDCVVCSGKPSRQSCIRSFGVESERQVKFGELCKSNYDASIN